MTPFLGGRVRGYLFCCVTGKFIDVLGAKTRLPWKCFVFASGQAFLSKTTSDGIRCPVVFSSRSVCHILLLHLTRGSGKLWQAGWEGLGARRSCMELEQPQHLWASSLEELHPQHWGHPGLASVFGCGRCSKSVSKGQRLLLCAQWVIGFSFSFVEMLWKEGFLRSSENLCFEKEKMKWKDNMRRQVWCPVLL